MSGETLFERAAMSREERLVWSALEGRRGRAAALKCAELQQMTGLHERAVRKCVKALVERHGKALCSDTGAGFWTAADAEEERAVARSLIHRGASIIRRARKLLSQEQFRRLCGEERLAFYEEGS